MYPPLHPNSSLSTVFSPFPPTSSFYSTPPSSRPPTSSPLLPSLSMAIGALSNALGLWILARAYAHSRRLRRSRAQFLLLASGLLVTDLAGHLITGSFVLWLYSNGVLPMAGCQFLGGCMVFFGLSPLLLGLLMACERCIGLTKPLWHSAVVTQTRARISLGLAWAVALLVSTLPLLGYGTYGLQPSGTWCFLEEPPGFCLLFSGLGLGSLAAALVCNLVVGITLLRARLLRASREKHRRRHRGARSHDLEMMVQLLAITIASCVCWSPLLSLHLHSSGFLHPLSSAHINCSLFFCLCTLSIWAFSFLQDHMVDEVSVVMLQTGTPLPRPNWLLFTVRLASCNQILDPWIYILLRRAVLRRLCSIFVRVSRVRGGKPIRWDPRDFQSSGHSEISHL